MEENPAPTPDGPNPKKEGRFKWILILALFVAPAIVSFLSAMAGWDGLAVASPLIGGLVGGLYCGIQLARRLGTAIYAKILIGIFFCAVIGCVIIGIGFGGCALGNYKIDFR